MIRRSGRLMALLLCAILVVCMFTMQAVYGEDTTEPIKADEGQTVKQDGNVTVTTDQTTAVEAKNNATVTVNGDVTSGVNGRSRTEENPGIHAEDSTVTVNGDVTTNGRNNSEGVYASNSTVTVNGNVTTTGSDNNNEGVVANQGSTVNVGDISTRTFQTEAIMASESSVTSGNIYVTGDEAWAVNAFNSSTVDVKDILIDNVRYGGGIIVSGGAVVTADNVTTNGIASIGVGVGMYDATPSLADIRGDIVATNTASNGVELWFNSTVRAQGDVRAEGDLGYGAVIRLTNKYAEYYNGDPTLIVEGTLAGSQAPIAIIPDWNEDGGLILDLESYSLPNIIVSTLQKGSSWISAVYENDDGELIEITDSAVQALKDAILNNVDYIVHSDGFTVNGAENKDIAEVGKTYLVAKEGTQLTLTPIVPSGHELATTDFGTYQPEQDENGNYILTVAQDGSLYFTATTEVIPSDPDPSGGESKAKSTIAKTSTTSTDKATTVSDITPQTGDNTNMVTWIVILTLAATVLCGAICFRRRNSSRATE